ncbi:MAG: Cof-type HAD-IIB family hydrolase [Clostridiales bacterium]|nr:Cof-type HAD-IIB family hydrolase [Clostridiales bacterium]
MIRLIASDLDGTLIPEGTQEIEPGFMEVLEELLDRGYLFCAASGRQYANMQRIFEGFRDRMVFVCENGALAMENGEQKYILEIPRDRVNAIAEDILSFPETEICLSGVKACYIQPRTEWFEHQLFHVLKNKCEIFETLDEIDDTIVKIAAYIHDFSENGKRIQTILNEKYGEYAKFVMGGNDWLDMIVNHSGKGLALEAILEQKGLKTNEIMVFGDNQNDISMLELTPNSYAMAHAAEDVKKHAGHTCVSVTETLREFFLTSNNCYGIMDVNEIS